MKFTYRSGHRPYDGVTIKYGIGVGGFGEVYFGQTDSGKEVALKCLLKNSEVELRGLRECLNLKHPNLVDIHDLREDAAGNHWVVMEYIKGETLRDVLKRYPKGLEIERAKRWFLGLASAIAYLHDQGVVHRDLKPGNIFIENDFVKIGDYGLCKQISASNHDPQTVSVGTPHYMAPETYSGNYGKQVDIYAAGVLLYEMLTGQVPFDGGSPLELMFKHQSEPPDLSRVPTEFRAILARALAKNPTHRYLTVAELAHDVAAVGTPMPLGQAQPAPAVPAALTTPAARPSNPGWELCATLLSSTVLVLLATVIIAAAFRLEDWRLAGQFFFLALASTWAVLIPALCWTKRVNDSMGRRLVMLGLGLLVGLFALWLEGADLPPLLQNTAQASAPVTRARDETPGEALYRQLFPSLPSLALAASYMTFFGLAFFGLRWWKLAERRRSERFDFGVVVVAAILGFVLLLFWPAPGEKLGLLTLVVTAAVVQIVSPWEEQRSARPRKLRLRNA